MGAPTPLAPQRRRVKPSAPAPTAPAKPSAPTRPSAPLESAPPMSTAHALPDHPGDSAPAGATARGLNRWLRPGTLRSQYIFTEIFQKPLSLRDEDERIP